MDDYVEDKLKEWGLERFMDNFEGRCFGFLSGGGCKISLDHKIIRNTGDIVG